jgi:hypothetical protein
MVVRRAKSIQTHLPLPYEGFYAPECDILGKNVLRSLCRRMRRSSIRSLDQRSINKIARQLNKGRTLIGRWSKRYAWVTHVRAYNE